MTFALCNLGARSLGRAARMALQARKPLATHSVMPVRIVATAGPSNPSFDNPLRTAFGAHWSLPGSSLVAVFALQLQCPIRNHCAATPSVLNGVL